MDDLNMVLRTYEQTGELQQTVREEMEFEEDGGGTGTKPQIVQPQQLVGHEQQMPGMLPQQPPPPSPGTSSNYPTFPSYGPPIQMQNYPPHFQPQQVQPAPNMPYYQPYPPTVEPPPESGGKLAKLEELSGMLSLAADSPSGFGAGGGTVGNNCNF